MANSDLLAPLPKNWCNPNFHNINSDGSFSTSGNITVANANPSVTINNTVGNTNRASLVLRGNPAKQNSALQSLQDGSLALQSFEPNVNVFLIPTGSGLISIPKNGNQLSLGSTTAYTINFPNPASARSVFMQDPLVDSGFVMSSKGTVQQLTNITTAVAYNGPSVAITTVNMTGAGISPIFNNAAQLRTFTLFNNYISLSSIVQVTIAAYTGVYATNGVPYVNVAQVINGAVFINLMNINSVNDLAGFLTIHVNIT